MRITGKLLGLILTLLLASCGPVAISEERCQEIATLREQIGREYTERDFRAWASGAYSLPLDSIEIRKGLNDQCRIVRWRMEDCEYAVLLDESRVAWVGLGFTHLVSLGSLVACLGEPEWYTARYWNNYNRGYELDLHVSFPEKGIMAGGGRIYWSQPSQPPLIKRSFPMLSVTLVSPGSMEDVLAQAYDDYGYGWPKGSDFLPWPEDWRDIEVQIDPSIEP